MSEVTDIRKLEIFKRGLEAKPTFEEFEAIFIDCATCSSKVLGIVAAGKLQEIFLKPEFDEETRVALIEGAAYTMITTNLHETLTAFGDFMQASKPKPKNLYEKHMANNCPDCPPEKPNAG